MKNQGQIKILLVIKLLTIFISSSYSQITYKGKVYNKNTNEALPYVSVGLMREDIGINANEMGEFKLISFNSYSTDTFIFNCLGYELSKVVVKNIETSFLIETLNEKPIV